MESRRVLIVNADDFGYDPAVTRGILLAAKAGFVRSTTLMVNTPFSKEAAGQTGALAVGLHLNLCRFRPASHHFPLQFLNAGELAEARAAELPAEVVETETLAQLDELARLLARPATHIDVHKHLHRLPNVLEGVARVAHARGLPVRALDEPMRASLRSLGVATPDHFLGEAGAEAYWTHQRLLCALDELLPGVTELMCHPGFRPETLASGYAAQREVELAAFSAAGLLDLANRAGIVLSDFSSLGPGGQRQVDGAGRRR